MRLLFSIPTLEVGGAERTCIAYLNHLKGFQSFLAVQFKRGPLLRELPSDVTVFETVSSPDGDLQSRGEQERKLWSQPIFLLSQAYQLKKLAEQNGCQALISFITMPNIIALLAKFFFDRRLKVVINVHDVTSQILEHSKLKPYERFLLKRLIRFFYPRADVIVAVAQGIKRDLMESFGVPAKKIVVIHNPIDVQGICARAAEPVAHPWFADRSEPLIIAVGRLVKLKGFDLLIRSVAQLSVPVRLALIGDGEERAALEGLVTELGLTDRVALLGFQENPWRYMARADLFVLSSLTEGMPNVIGEAMALGLPVVATDCSPGVWEYLDDGQAGLLLPPGDSQALAQGIARLLSDELLRQELAQRSRERIAQFDLTVAVQAYENLLKSFFA